MMKHPVLRLWDRCVFVHAEKTAAAVLMGCRSFLLVLMSGPEGTSGSGMRI